MNATRYLYRVSIVAAVAVLAALSAGVTSAADEPGAPDTLFIDSARAISPDGPVVPLRFFNDEPLTHIEVTLRSTLAALSVDSFSFVGGRVAAYQLKGAILDSGRLVLFVLPFVDEPDIPEGTGLLGHVYTSVVDSLAPFTAFLDTITIGTDTIQHSTTFNDPSLQPFVPVIKTQPITVEARCCFGKRGNVNGSPDNVVDISDLTYLIEALFINVNLDYPCPHEANVNGSPDGVVDIADLTALVDVLFINLDMSVVADCP